MADTRISNSQSNPYTSPNAAETVGDATHVGRSKPRFWMFASLWSLGTFLYSILPITDELLGLGLPGNSIGYAIVASLVLVIASLFVAPFRISYRLLAFVLFIILIPIQMVVTGFLLIVFFGMDGVQ